MPYQQWPQADRARVREVLGRQAGALATLHSAAGLESSSFGIRYRDGFDAEAPQLLPLLDAARLLVVEARIAIADGDEELTVLALATLFRMATALERESTLIASLVGVAVERMGLTAACEAVASEQPFALPEEFLGRLVEVSSTGVEHGEMLRRVAAAWQATVRLAHAEGGRGPQSDPGRDGLSLPEDLDLEQLACAAARVGELADVPFGTARDRFEELRTMLGPADSGLGGDLKGFVGGIGRTQSVDAQRQLLRAAVAVRRMGLEGGAYPRERPAIPELTEPDPFSGQQLAYLVGDDGSVTIDLVGVRELIGEVALTSVARAISPVVLPAP